LETWLEILKKYGYIKSETLADTLTLVDVLEGDNVELNDEVILTMKISQN